MTTAQPMALTETPPADAGSMEVPAVRTIRGNKGIDLAHGISVDSAFKEAASAATHGAETVKGQDFVATSVVNALAKVGRDAALRAPDHHPAGHGHGAGNGHAGQDATGDADLVDTGDSATGDTDLVATGDGDAGDGNSSDDGAEGDTTITLFAPNPDPLDPDIIDGSDTVVTNLAVTPEVTVTPEVNVTTLADAAQLDIGSLTGSPESDPATVTDLDASTDALAAHSRTRAGDLDIADDTASLTRAQILQQAGTAMLAQANSSTDIARSLLDNGNGRGDTVDSASDDPDAAFEGDFADFAVASGLQEHEDAEAAVTDAAVHDTDQATSISVDIDDQQGADLSTSLYDASSSL